MRRFFLLPVVISFFLLLMYPNYGFAAPMDEPLITAPILPEKALVYDFPEIEPTADIAAYPSPFGAERIRVVSYEPGGVIQHSYKLLKKCFSKDAPEDRFEITAPQGEPDFLIDAAGCEACELMIMGFDENEAVASVTPKATVDLPRFHGFKKAVNGYQPQSERRTLQDSKLEIDAGDFPYIRVYGELSETMRRAVSKGEMIVGGLTENGISQEIIDFSQYHDGRPVDIVLLVDNSASMKAQSVWFLPKITAFIDSLSQTGRDFRLGVLPFGSASETKTYLGSGKVFNAPIDDIDAILSFDSPFDDVVGALNTISDIDNWRENARKIVVLITNEPVYADRDGAKTIVSNLNQHNIRVFGFLPYQNPFTQKIIRQTGGDSVHFDNNGLADLISKFFPVGNDFSIVYKTDALSGSEARKTSASLEYTDADGRRIAVPDLPADYTMPNPFELMLTPETAELYRKQQERRKSLTIAVKVVKQDEALPDPALTLYYKDSRDETYRSLAMTVTDDDVYTASIPAEDMDGYGIHYYIDALLDDYHASLPSANPDLQPYSFAVLPNFIPEYAFSDTTASEAVPGQPFTIEITLFDDTQTLTHAALYYRTIGESTYQVIEQDVTKQKDEYTFEIPAEVVQAPGIEYYITETDDKGVIRYIGDMDHPRSVAAAEEDDDDRRIFLWGQRHYGSDFVVWAESFTTDGNNNTVTVGDLVYIGRDDDSPMLGYRPGAGGALIIRSDNRIFLTKTDQGTLFANDIKTRRNNQAHDEDLFTGNFSRNDGDGYNQLSISLDVTSTTQKIVSIFEYALALNARYTSTSKIAVDYTAVTVTGSQIDFVLQNPIFQFVDFGGVTSVNTMIWAKEETVSTSKQTFSINAIKFDLIDLLSASVTIDPINLGLEISGGGLVFGGLTGKLINISGKKFPSLAEADGSGLNGFTIGAQLNPPALTRLSLNITVPSMISSQITIPTSFYPAIPFGVAPKSLGLDIKDFGVKRPPPAITVSLTGNVYDVGKVIAQLEDLLLMSFLTGTISATLDCDSRIALSGNVTCLFFELGGFYGHISRHAPQIKFGGHATFAVPLPPLWIESLYVKLQLGIEGYHRNIDDIGFGGSAGMTVQPPWLVAAIMRGIGACSGQCELAGITGSISGTFGPSQKTLKLYGETFLDYRYWGCSSGWQTCYAWFVPYPCCPTWGWIPGRYKAWVTVNILPSRSIDAGASKVYRKNSEPGIERKSMTVQDENGEDVLVILEFNYGRPIAVIEGGGDRRANPQTITLNEQHDNATIKVESETGIPQVKVTTPILKAEGVEELLAFNSNDHTGQVEEDLMYFESSADEHTTVGFVKLALAGDYIVEILNIAEIGEYTIEFTVPNKSPEFEITSAQIVEQEDDYEIIEVTYNLSDPDSASDSVYTTFRLAKKGEEDNTETALFLIPEGRDTGDVDEDIKIYGTGQGKTVRLIVDRTQFQTGDYKLYGRAEDNTTAPVVSWSDITLNLYYEGIPNTPENFRYTQETTGILLEWDARPESENVLGYLLWVQNAGDEEDYYDIWVQGGTTNAYELLGLKNGVTYYIDISAVNQDYEFSFASDPLTVTPTGMTVEGAPDLVLENTSVSIGPAEGEWGEWDDWDPEQEWFKVIFSVTNNGTAASTGGNIAIYFGKIDADHAVVDERDGEFASIEPLMPGESVEYEYLIDLTLLEDLSADGKYAADYPCLIVIENVTPTEINTDNNSGIVEEIVNENLVQRTLNLNAGWNFAALPVDTFASAEVDPEIPQNVYGLLFGKDATLHQYLYEDWYTYADYQSRDAEDYLDYTFSDEGFWIYVPHAKTVTFEGWKYQTDPFYLNEGTWSMMGTGEQIDDPLAYFQAEDPTVQAIWVDNNGQWVKNPSTIASGEGFWVSRSAAEEPPPRPTITGLQRIIGILKTLAGKQGYPIDDIDLIQDNVIDIGDAIYGLQEEAVIR